MTAPFEAPAQHHHRRGQMALAFQETLTAIVRIRADLPFGTDAEAFRARLRQMLGAADGEMRAAGYHQDYSKLAVYAVIAFLDETALNSRQPVFAHWSSKPMQEEVFGDHTAGETFYRHLEALIAQQDSDDLGDLLEVFQTCLALGFTGRFASPADPGRRAVMSGAADKLRRIRGGAATLASPWALPTQEKPATSRDPWLRPLLVATAVAAGFAVVLFLVFKLTLNPSLM